MQQTRGHTEFGIRWNDVNHTRVDAHCLGRFKHVHRRDALQQLREHRLLRRVEVLHDEIRECAASRDGSEKRLQRGKTTGRGAETDDARHRGTIIARSLRLN